MDDIGCVGAIVRLPGKEKVLVRLIYHQPGSCLCCHLCQPVQYLSRQRHTCNRASLRPWGHSAHSIGSIGGNSACARLRQIAHMSHLPNSYQVLASAVILASLFNTSHVSVTPVKEVLSASISEHNPPDPYPYDPNDTNSASGQLQRHGLSRVALPLPPALYRATCPTWPKARLTAHLLGCRGSQCTRALAGLRSPVHLPASPDLDTNCQGHCVHMQ